MRGERSAASLQPCRRAHPYPAEAGDRSRDPRPSLGRAAAGRGDTRGAGRARVASVHRALAGRRPRQPLLPRQRTLRRAPRAPAAAAEGRVERVLHHGRRLRRVARGAGRARLRGRTTGSDGRLIAVYVAAPSTYDRHSLLRARPVARAERAEQALRDAEGHLAGVVPELQRWRGHRRESRWGSARPARTRSSSAHAASEGSGGGAGETSHALLHETDRPVIVLTEGAVERQVALGRGPGRGPHDDGGGLDGLDAARSALDYAVRRAGVDGGRLVAVCAYAPASFLGAPYYGRALEDSQARARERRAERDWRAEIAIDTDLARTARLLRAMVRAAATNDARELVVGSRGLGPSGRRSACPTSCCTAPTARSRSCRPRARLTRGARRGQRSGGSGQRKGQDSG